nr:MAG TPA_asm: hypothetical protein [Bacteriophage sp.]
MEARYSNSNRGSGLIFMLFCPMTMYCLEVENVS